MCMSGVVASLTPELEEAEGGAIERDLLGLVGKRAKPWPLPVVQRH